MVIKVPDKINKAIDDVIDNWEKIPTWIKLWAEHNPRNPITKTEYTGINWIMTNSTASVMHYKTNQYMTLKQANSIGCSVKSGEISIPILFFRMIEKKVKDDSRRPGEICSKDLNSFPVLAYYNVFNLDQLEGEKIEDFKKSAIVNTDYKIPTDINTLIAKHGIHLELTDGGRAYFSPAQDYISMPKPEYFKTQNACLEVLAHEMTHWTGHPKRLARFETIQESKQEYSKEELIAELGSMLFLNYYGALDDDLYINQKAYLKSWVKNLRDKKTELISALSKSFKAFNYLIEVQS